MNRMTWLFVTGFALATAVGCGGGSASTPTSPTPAATTPTTPAPTTPPVSSGPPTGASWVFTGGSWQPIGTPPACANPLNLPLPVNIDRATSVLYPGQTRGGDYKPHGGFRFDLAGQTSSVTVTAPLAATILRGNRFLMGGEIQYGFDFVNSCGIMYRLGHLRDLSARFQALAETLPAALEGNSVTRPITGQTVAQGEAIATGIGLRDRGLNVFVDFGVYDLRQRNAASQNGAWFAAHPGDLAPYAVCWFDLLTASDAARVRALPPSDPTSGRTSDYCR